MSNDYNRLISDIDSGLCPDKSFDLIKRELIIAQRSAVMYFVDGFIKDEMYEKILEYFFKMKPEELDGIDDAERFTRNRMPYVEISYAYDVEEIKSAILSGPSVIIIDGIKGAVIADTRTYPMRSIEEPEKDKSLRGSRDGFVETIVMNTAMIRRRIRDERLRMEYYQIGKSSKVDVAISYIDGAADSKTIDILRKRLKEIDIKGISMTQQALSETLVKTAFLNPYPKFKFTERPDYASASILDGKIVLVMDNSPAVMILPVSAGDFFRETDDYYFAPVTGSYVRIIRAIVALFTVIATPLYLLMINNPQYMPEWLSFMKPNVGGEIPLIVQFLILEFIIDGLRLASLNTPNSLSSAFGIIGGLLLSDFAITAGWFIVETILFMSFVTIASYSQPSFEMGYAMKFERLVLLVAVQLFALWGFIAGIVFFIAAMLMTKTLSGRNYLYPIIPFNAKAFLGLFVRPGIKSNH